MAANYLTMGSQEHRKAGRTEAAPPLPSSFLTVFLILPLYQEPHNIEAAGMLSKAACKMRTQAAQLSEAALQAREAAVACATKARQLLLQRASASERVQLVYGACDHLQGALARIKEAQACVQELREYAVAGAEPGGLDGHRDVTAALQSRVRRDSLCSDGGMMIVMVG